MSERETDDGAPRQIPPHRSGGVIWPDGQLERANYVPPGPPDPPRLCKHCDTRRFDHGVIHEPECPSLKRAVAIPQQESTVNDGQFDSSDTGASFREWRVGRGLSLRETAAMLGVEPVRLGEFERGVQQEPEGRSELDAKCTRCGHHLGAHYGNDAPANARGCAFVDCECERFLAQQAPEGNEITYPYPALQDRERTHWEGCWQDPGHHNCAVAEVHRLRAEQEQEPGGS